MEKEDDRIRDAFENRAEAEEAERIKCEQCMEHVVFLLKDKDHEFSIGLSTILECLAFAIRSGDLPKLPSSWCAQVDGACGYFFEEEDVSYSDYYEYHENIQDRNSAGGTEI